MLGGGVRGEESTGGVLVPRSQPPRHTYARLSVCLASTTVNLLAATRK